MSRPSRESALSGQAATPNLGARTGLWIATAGLLIHALAWIATSRVIA
ncbi:MAG: hypothetical protein SF069_08820 [Phycisphaerae bacterium]|nr:hypothetical protein [Phycisphaerae bacterium]